jgi:hypothetical protein
MYSNPFFFLEGEKHPFSFFLVLSVSSYQQRDATPRAVSSPVKLGYHASLNIQPYSTSCHCVVSVNQVFPEQCQPVAVFHYKLPFS